MALWHNHAPRLHQPFARLIESTSHTWLIQPGSTLLVQPGCWRGRPRAIQRGLLDQGRRCRRRCRSRRLAVGLPLASAEICQVAHRASCANVVSNHRPETHQGRVLRHRDRVHASGCQGGRSRGCDAGCQRPARHPRPCDHAAMLRGVDGQGPNRGPNALLDSCGLNSHMSAQARGRDNSKD
eukprot:364658-Chlamydomonas_euryale.AAC.1